MGHAYPSIIETIPNSQIYAIQGFSPLKLTLLYDNYVQLIAVSIVGATLLSCYLYISSFIGKDKILAKGGNTGNHIYDFFIGNLFTLYLFISRLWNLFPINWSACWHLMFFHFSCSLTNYFQFFDILFYLNVCYFRSNVYSFFVFLCSFIFLFIFPILQQ